jgi:hypothetical protein
MAEVAIRRNIFQSVRRRIAKFRLPAPRGSHMTKFLLGKPADQGSRVAKLRAASVVRPANRPNAASEPRRGNGSFSKTIAFGLGKSQNGKLLARRGRRSSTT